MAEGPVRLSYTPRDMSGSPSDSPRLFLGADMPEVDRAPLVGGEVVVFSAGSPGREGPNEDAAAVLPFGPDAAVLAVADGAGGGRAGSRASTLALQSLAAALDEARNDGSLLRNAILNGFERANQAVLDLGVGAATTLAAVEIGEGAIRPYHVGDSLILLVGQRGRVKLETISHSPVGFAVEAGLLDATDAIHHEDRHFVSNTLGAPDMRIEVGAVRTLAPRDTLLLASDGLSDNLHIPEIVEHVRTGALGDSCEELAATARRRMYVPAEDEPSKPDDLTLVAFRPRVCRARRPA
jgi:serine/threonine protein phosphatase PrpC